MHVCTRMVFSTATALVSSSTAIASLLVRLALARARAFALARARALAFALWAPAFSLLFGHAAFDEEPVACWGQEMMQV